jgi:hypothetical protein
LKTCVAFATIFLVASFAAIPFLKPLQKICKKTQTWLRKGIAAKDATRKIVANATHVFKNRNLEVWEAKVATTKNVWLKSA